MSKVLIMAGGTGGHVFPALTVAAALQAEGHEVCWLGTRRGIESRVVPEAGIAIEYLSIEGVRGRGLKGLIKAPFLLIRALGQSMGVLRRYQPNVILGFGGFVSGPGGLAAWLKRVPLLIHEQNAVAGTTNRLLARFASRIATGFEGVLPQGEWVGNPVRAEIESLPEPYLRFSERANTPQNILVLGGSLGAQAINELVPEALGAIASVERGHVWHQCGPQHVESTLATYMRHQVEAKVEPFIRDMAAAYAWADLVICRAGALTVAELMAAGVGAILVPLPHAIDDHQTCNAAVLAGAGAGLSVPQRDLNTTRLADLLSGEFSNRTALLQMAEKARDLHRPAAAKRVVKIIEELVNG